MTIQRPEHLVAVRLGNPAHILRMPGTSRLFGSLDGADGVEVIDTRELFWIACLADGSIERVEVDEEFWANR